MKETQAMQMMKCEANTWHNEIGGGGRRKGEEEEEEEKEKEEQEEAEEAEECGENGHLVRMLCLKT